MRIDFHINFNGFCREAFQFYQSVLGGEVELLTYGETSSSTNVPEDWKDKIVHGNFRLSQICIAGADIVTEQYVAPEGFHLLLQLENESDAHRIFNSLASGGSVTMPLQKTFWSDCYGIVTDKYGVSWEINYAQA